MFGTEELFRLKPLDPCGAFSVRTEPYENVVVLKLLPKNPADFEKNPKDSTALHYDLVLNGVELGSGSQRINNPKLQKLVLEKWGLTEIDITERFGWFIEALSYGTPQHAGFAIGIDRLVAEILKQPSIRDVIPFPKTQSGMDPLTDAPSEINEEDLIEYNLRYIDNE